MPIRIQVSVPLPVNVSAGCRHIYIGHIGEVHYVSTVEKRFSFWWCPYDTEDVKTALLYQLISAAMSAAERLHERCFPCAAAVHFCDCVSAAVATLRATGALQESCRKMVIGSNMVEKQRFCSALQRYLNKSMARNVPERLLRANNEQCRQHGQE